MRTIGPVLALLVMLPAQASAENIWASAYFSDRWHGAFTRDAITDAHIFSTYVATADVNDKHIGPDLARVVLECRSGKARLVVEWSFKAAGPTNLAVAYRFAGQPGRTLKARYVNRTREEITAVADIRQFLADARGADALVVRADSDQYGVNTARFRTRAGTDMAERFGAACPSVAVR